LKVSESCDNIIETKEIKSRNLFRGSWF